MIGCCSLLLSGLFACKSSGEKEIHRDPTKMDGLQQVMEQEFRMTRDPQLNRVPRERLVIAREFMKSIENSLAGRTTALNWEERGPSNVGGRTRAMIIDKADASGNTVLAGSVSGGMFRTTNFTSATPSWAPVNDFLSNLAITAMVQDPVNFNVMYAGTGEGWINVDAVKGAGIFKSTDGGITWAIMPSTSTFEYIQDMAIDNNGAIFVSQRNLQSANRGVIRSADGGTTWTQVLGAPLPGFNTGRAADLEVASNGDVYASLGLVGANFANRSVVMKSSFATHGANTGALGTWTEITPVTSNVTQRTEILLAPSDPQRVYLLMQDSASHQVLNIYRSSNGGSTWATLPTAAALNNGGASQTWFNLIGAVDPNNADVLIVGGLHLAKSTNAGDSWITISAGAIHVDQHFLQYVGSDKLVVGNDGGVYYSTNINTGSPSFTNKNNGYNVTQFYGCDLHPTNVNYFLAGAQDNGTQRFSAAGINTTTLATGGDGGFPHIDQTDGQLQIAAFTGNNYSRSSNGGASFSSLGSGINNNRGQFINPTDFDDNSKVLYCGDDAGRYYYITGLSGGTPAGNIANVPLMGARELTAVKVDPSAANTIYIGASYGGLAPAVLRLSSANTTNPTVMNTASIGVPANASISCIDVDPANPNHLVVTLSNYGVASVWESTNGGTTFTNIEGNLPDMPVRWAVIAPANAQLNGAAGGNGGIILGTELGVWTTSATAGAATQWIPNNDGLANVRTDMLRYRASDNTLVAATHGRGLFTSTVPTVITGVPNVPATKDFIKYISAEGGNLRIVTGTLQTRTMEIRLLNMQGQVIYRSRTAYQNTVVDMNRFTTGSYIVQIAGDKKEHFVEQIVKR